MTNMCFQNVKKKSTLHQSTNFLSLFFFFLQNDTKGHYRDVLLGLCGAY